MPTVNPAWVPRLIPWFLAEDEEVRHGFQGTRMGQVSALDM